MSKTPTWYGWPSSTVRWSTALPPAESATSESCVTWKSTNPLSAYQRGSRSRTSWSTFRSSYSPFWNHQKPSGRVSMCLTTCLSPKRLLPSTTTWLMATRWPSFTS